MKKNSPFLTLFITFLLAFLPLASFLFALKNDMFLGYYPPKFLISEVIHNGNIPLWNPYISFGIPFYGDMNGAYWSPITWIIASTIGYNVYVLTIEVMFYIWIGGIGMYYLTEHWISRKSIRLISAIAFMCCGYNVGHLQHLNWISGAAFLPWCLWSFINLYKETNIKTYLIGVILFYLLISSAHPGIIISSFYFFSSLLILFFIKKYQTGKLKEFTSILKKYLIFFVLLLVLCTGIVLGYSDIIPYFSRGEIISLKSSLTYPTTPESWVSFFSPFVTVKNSDFFKTDIAMRNNYFGILLLICLILCFYKSKTNWQRFFIASGLCFLLLSTGGFFKTIAYYTLPYIGYVRSNGEFRIFAIFCFICTATIELEKYLDNNPPIKITGRIKKIIIAVGMIPIIWAIYSIIKSNESVLFTAPIHSDLPLRNKLKNIIDSISFYDTIIIQIPIQLFLIFLFLKKLAEKNIRWLLFLTIIDLSISTELNLPFTGVGKNSVADLNSIHKRAPKGIITPPLQPLAKNDTLNQRDFTLVGEWGFYNKQMGSPRRVIYPVTLKVTEAYYDSIEKNSNLNMKNNPFLFLGKTSGNNITIDNNSNLIQKNIISFTTNKIEVDFTSINKGELILLQNYYPHWYYYKKNKRYPVNKAGINFISIPVSKGKNQITIQFEPQLIEKTLIFSFIIFWGYLFLLLCIKIKSAFLS